LAEYLTAARLFNQVNSADFIASEDILKTKGYRAVLIADIVSLDPSFAVPKWVLVVSLLPNPLFFILPGITLLPLVLWPKDMRFHAVLDHVRLKDLRTGEVVWSGKVEVFQEEKKPTRHFTAKWFLGETAERLSKELIRQLVEAKLSF